MRPDFDKILTERERIGSKLKYHKVRNRKRSESFEDLPHMEGMSSIHAKVARDWKHLNENLSPLYRYLRKQIGRPWNTVYSDIRQMMGKNPNAVKGHILQHLYGFNGVEKDVEFVGKQVFYLDTKWRAQRELYNDTLYVDQQGILRKYKTKNNKKSWKQLQEDKWMETARHLPDGNQARKINGVWYYVTLKDIKESDIYAQQYGSRTVKVCLVSDILGIRGEPQNFIAAYTRRVFAVSKRTMNHKELKENNLQND
jgi:hypothetical protein